MNAPDPKTSPSGTDSGEATEQKPFPFPTAEKHDEAPEPIEQPVVETPSEDALDHGVEESFPASDPVSVSVTKVTKKQPD